VQVSQRILSDLPAIRPERFTDDKPASRYESKTP